MTDKLKPPGWVEPDPLRCKEFALGSDEIVTVSLWSAVQWSPVPKPVRQTLVQSALEKDCEFSLEVVCGNMAGPIPASLNLDFHGCVKNWDGYLEPTGKKDLATGNDIACFVVRKEVKGKEKKSVVTWVAPDLNLSKSGFFGKGAANLSVSSVHCEPPTLQLPPETLHIDNPFDLVVEYGAKKKELTLADANSAGGLVPEVLLVGTPLQITVNKVPAFLKGCSLQCCLASEKPTGPKIIQWQTVVEGEELLYESYLVGLNSLRELHPLLATSFMSFDIRVVFQATIGTDKDAKQVLIADIPLATDIPKPMALDFTWLDRDRNTHASRFGGSAAEEFGLQVALWMQSNPGASTGSTNASPVSPGTSYAKKPKETPNPFPLPQQRPIKDLQSYLAASASPPFQVVDVPSSGSASGPVFVSALRAQGADLRLWLGNVYPGTRIKFTAFVGFTPFSDPGPQELHHLAILPNPSVKRAREFPEGITIIGSDVDSPQTIDLRGLWPVFSGLEFDRFKVRNIFLVLAFPQTDGKGGITDIPFRHLLDIHPKQEQGVVRFSKDRVRVEQCESPVALASEGITGVGTIEKVFGSDKVKYDDKYRPMGLVTLVEKGREIIEMPYTVLNYAKLMVSSAQTWDPGRGTDGNWRPSTLEEVIPAVDPYEGKDPNGELPHKFQFVKLKSKYKIDHKVLESYYTVYGSGKPEFLALIPRLAKLIVETAFENSLDPLYCASHVITEFSAPSKGMVDGTKTYYNFFGVNAKHASKVGVQEALSFAKAKGWDSPEKGMKGGIQFLREWIYGEGKDRDTLYDMRWDTKAHSRTGLNGARMVYGTGITWAILASDFMQKIYDKLPEKPKLDLIVPRYQK